MRQGPKLEKEDERPAVEIRGEPRHDAARQRGHALRVDDESLPVREQELGAPRPMAREGRTSAIPARFVR